MSRPIHWQAHHLAPSSATTATVSPRSPIAAAAQAAEARQAQVQLQAPANPRANEPFQPLMNVKAPFCKILNNELLPRESKSQAVATLRTLLTLTGNILDPPEPASAAKYRMIRLTNPKIKTDIVDVKGAQDLLVAAGFRIRVVEMREQLVYPSEPNSDQLYALKTAHHVFENVLERTEKLLAEEELRKQAAKDEAEMTTRMVLLQIAEDSRLRGERQERQGRNRNGQRRREEVNRNANLRPVLDGADFDRA